MAGLPKFEELENFLSLGELEAAMAKTKAVRTSPGEGVTVLYWEDRQFGHVKPQAVDSTEHMNHSFLAQVKAL
jgi:hypothetical protein